MRHRTEDFYEIPPIENEDHFVFLLWKNTYEELMKGGIEVQEFYIYSGLCCYHIKAKCINQKGDTRYFLDIYYTPSEHEIHFIFDTYSIR